MGKILIPGSFGGGVTSDDVTAGKAQVLKGYKTVTRDSDDEVVEGAIRVVDTAQDNYSKTRTTEYGLDKNRNAFYMHLPQRSAYYTRNDNIPHVEVDADVLGNASPNQVLSGATATSKNGVNFQGSFPVTSDADSMEELWYYNDHGNDSYVTRIPEAAYIRYWNADRTQSWNPWIRIKRTLIKSSINYHPELTIDTITTLGERGQISDRGESAGVSYYQIREDGSGRLYILFKNGWYHRAPWTDPQGHTHEAYLYLTYEQLKNLFGIDGSKMLQGHNVAGVLGQIVSHPNENMALEIVNINWTNPKKFGFRFQQGYYPNSGQYPPIVEVNYGDLANALGIRADKMLNDINILGIQGNIPYWVCNTGDVISAVNNEGFAWDDTYAGRGRGIVVKIANGHVLAGANYAFLPSPNLYPQNVVKGININGVTGTRDFTDKVNDYTVAANLEISMSNLEQVISLGNAYSGSETVFFGVDLVGEDVYDGFLRRDKGNGHYLIGRIPVSKSDSNLIGTYIRNVPVQIEIIRDGAGNISLVHHGPNQLLGVTKLNVYIYAHSSISFRL
ncbi:hypothetical protein [Lachnoanaerobaculum saburreum]|uniref:Uncharacterized protein n=1 Tax=Lachnoanaerobaculum saburreum DSM 3986 TaxID=887325 RepID=E6LJC8_9FIRM|nr:hypothetical protein [Lachnoanaerobaculum saburreum]EFU78062.1 hypothetical protein HMPREF0381_0063 [Lachnoanaerobaculum saburreum DSM 3986]